MALFSRGRPAPADDPVADLDPPAPEDEAPAADPTICPRCGGKLTNPDGLGWCAGCGYCRSLEEEGQTVAPPPEAAQPKKPSPLGAAEFGEAMRRMPRWAWPLLGGVALVATGSVIADYRLPEECLARALWSAIQMMLSVIGTSLLTPAVGCSFSIARVVMALPAAETARPATSSVIVPRI